MSFKLFLFRNYYFTIGFLFLLYLFINPNTSTDQFYLFFCLYLLFLPINQIVKKLRSLTLRLFFVIIFLSHIIGSILFFGSKNIFNYSGFLAIKNFNFDIFEYLNTYSYLFLFWYSIIFLYLVTEKFTFYKIKKVKLILYLLKIKTYKSQNRIINLIFFTSLIILIITINWMFQHSFGITGIDTGIQILPFHLGGLIFYTIRFVFPLIIFFLLYINTNIKFIHLLSVFIFSVLYGIASASRIGFLFYNLILFYFLLKRKNYFLFLLSLFTTIVMLFYIEISRNLIYGPNQINESAGFSIFEHLINIYKYALTAEFNYSTLVNSMLFRIGGTQDVVLAFQYDNNLFGGSLNEFIRYTINPKIIDVDLLQRELYGWSPSQDSGFSTGDGGFSAELLMIANHSYFKILLLSIFFFFLFKLYDYLYFNIIDDKSKILSAVIIFLNVLSIIIKFPLFFNLICLILLYFISKFKFEFKYLQIIK